MCVRRDGRALHGMPERIRHDGGARAAPLAPPARAITARARWPRLSARSTAAAAGWQALCTSTAATFRARRWARTDEGAIVRSAARNQVRFDISVFAIMLAASAALGGVVGGTTRASETPKTAGEFVWHDLVTQDAAASRAFYGALFGWTFQAAKGVEPNYTIIKQDNYPIGGIVTAANAETIPQWLSYVVAPDVNLATAAFKESGGRVYREPLDVRKDLRVSVVEDPQGAPLGLASRGPTVRSVDVPPIHRWLWMEYVALDPAPALTFYSRVLGYTSEVMETRQGRSYHLLKTDRPRAGLFGSLWEHKTSRWLPYVRVGDAEATAARVARLGGRVVLAPSAEIRNGSLAIVLDPAGAPLALQEFPFDRNARGYP
jgi:hypothetical protein